MIGGGEPTSVFTLAGFLLLLPSGDFAGALVGFVDGLVGGLVGGLVEGLATNVLEEPVVGTLGFLVVVVGKLGSPGQIWHEGFSGQGGRPTGYTQKSGSLHGGHDLFGQGSLQFFGQGFFVGHGEHSGQGSLLFLSKLRII